MMTRVIALLTMLAFGALTAAVPSHAAGMLMGGEPAAHMGHMAMAAASPTADCCADTQADAGDRGFCSFACSGLTYQAVLAPVAWWPAWHEDAYVSANDSLVPGLGPDLTERPPKARLL